MTKPLCRDFSLLHHKFITEFQCYSHYNGPSFVDFHFTYQVYKVKYPLRKDL